MDYPRTVYKSPGKTKYGKNKSYDSILVHNEEELKMREDEGFINSFQDALCPKELVEEEIEDKELTKDEVMDILREKKIKFNPRDKKEVLVDLLYK